MNTRVQYCLFNAVELTYLHISPVSELSLLSPETDPASRSLETCRSLRERRERRRDEFSDDKQVPAKEELHGRNEW